jgi:PPOX class probable F420-dependent enzyme
MRVSRSIVHPYCAMRVNLLPEELGDLLQRPLVATLATYRRDGDVLLSPVWYEWRDGGAEMVLGRKDFKTQHLRRDARASLAVYENEPPLRGMELRGTATFLPLEGLHELRLRIYDRYMGELPPGPDETEVGVRIEGVFRAWDFADSFANTF